MFWSDDKNPEQFQVPKNVVDLSFKVSCKQIRLDHAQALTNAICDLLPWFRDEPQAAVHHIYIPQSGNGWLCSDSDEVIQLSRRTRLKIRIPHNRCAEVREISGKTISIAGNQLTFGSAETFLLSTITTLVARHVYIPDTEDDEQAFLQQAQQQINHLGIQVRKMLCGKAHRLDMPAGLIKTRSLMVADISPEESIKLQEQGIGDYYHYGLGIFIPQKGIAAVNATE